MAHAHTAGSSFGKHHGSPPRPRTPPSSHVTALAGRSSLLRTVGLNGHAMSTQTKTLTKHILKLLKSQSTLTAGTPALRGLRPSRRAASRTEEASVTCENQSASGRPIVSKVPGGLPFLAWRHAMTSQPPSQSPERVGNAASLTVVHRGIDSCIRSTDVVRPRGRSGRWLVPTPDASSMREKGMKGTSWPSYAS